MMSAQLTALGFRVAPSCANFLFLTAGSLRQNCARLLCDGVIIKPWREKV
jgi:histidinol-phosphate aminotransferase